MILAHMSSQNSEALFRIVLLAGFVIAVIFIVINVLIMRVASRYILKSQAATEHIVKRRLVQFSIKSLLTAMVFVALCAWILRYTRSNPILFCLYCWWGALWGSTWSLWRVRVASRTELALPLFVGGAAGGAVVAVLLAFMIPMPPMMWLLRILKIGALGALGGLLLGLLYYVVARFTMRGEIGTNNVIAPSPSPASHESSSP